MMPGSIKVVKSSASMHQKTKPSIPNMNIDTEDTVNVIMGNRGSLHGSFRGTP